MAARAALQGGHVVRGAPSPALDLPVPALDLAVCVLLCLALFVLLEQAGKTALEVAQEAGVESCVAALQQAA